uniref:Uncharacterized protein n=1 Tax=Leersia perrieri TaxID=77586 RepID=A0A0D9V3D0_9ORYZ
MAVGDSGPSPHLLTSLSHWRQGTPNLDPGGAPSRGGDGVGARRGSGGGARKEGGVAPSDRGRAREERSAWVRG